jgi:hypothetical protein
MIEFQEYLYVLQRVSLSVNPKANTKIRKSTEVTMTANDKNDKNVASPKSVSEAEAPLSPASVGSPVAQGP